MAAERAWVLNFDAEDELAAGAGYTPPRSVLARFGDLARRATGLVPDGDVVLPGNATGARGLCWCPTPRALRALRDAGAMVPEAPPQDVLRAVNDRAFCASLGQSIPHGVFARDEATIARALRESPAGTNWVLKRALSYAGRGRRRVRAGEYGDGDARWVRAAMADGAWGVQCEPWVERTMDAALHGWISRAGELVAGEPTVAVVDEHGQWVSSRRAHAGELDSTEDSALRAALEESARALYTAGYFGPFGVDAFRWRDVDGAERFNPRCEINARYSMGWAVGMGSRRPDLELVVSSRA